MVITARSENRSPDIVSDLEQVLIHFISKNDHSASVIGRVRAMTRRRWMFGKASSLQSPSASKKLFGSSLSVDFQSGFHLLISKGFGKWNAFLPEQHTFYFITQLHCLIYYNRWHWTTQMAGVAIFVKNRSCIWTIKESRRGIASLLVMIDLTGTYIVTHISKIQLVVYYHCCVLIG